MRPAAPPAGEDGREPEAEGPDPPEARCDEPPGEAALGPPRGCAPPPVRDSPWGARLAIPEEVVAPPEPPLWLPDDPELEEEEPDEEPPLSEPRRTACAHAPSGAASTATRHTPPSNVSLVMGALPGSVKPCFCNSTAIVRGRKQPSRVQAVKEVPPPLALQG